MQAPKALTAILAALLLAGCTSILRAPADVPVIRTPGSVAEANAALERAAADRVALEAAFMARERECYRRFFVNSCLIDAREARRQKLVEVRAIEVEMARYKRQAAVEERDREVAKAEADFAAEEAARAAGQQGAAAGQQGAAAPAPSAPPARRPRGISLAERQARHEAKMERLAEQEQADAPKRAEKAARYERKKQESERRQAAVAERKAEKEAGVRQRTEPPAK